MEVKLAINSCQSIYIHPSTEDVGQEVECQPPMQEVQGLDFSIAESERGVRVCDLSIGDVDTGGSDVQGHLHLLRKTGYVRSCRKRERGGEWGGRWRTKKKRKGGKKEKVFIFLRNLRQAGVSP